MWGFKHFFQLHNNANSVSVNRSSACGRCCRPLPKSIIYRSASGKTSSNKVVTRSAPTSVCRTLCDTARYNAIPSIPHHRSCKARGIPRRIRGCRHLLLSRASSGTICLIINKNVKSASTLRSSEQSPTPEPICAVYVIISQRGEHPRPN